MSAVFSNSLAIAFSNLCCCKSNLISSSLIPNTCFLAQVADTGEIPPPGSLTASLYSVILVCQASNLSSSACVDGLVKPKAKLSNSSSNPKTYKCIIAILFNSCIIDF